MKKKRILLLAVLLAVVAAFMIQVLRPREPNYQGKNLTYWLEYHATIWDNPLSPATTNQLVQEAVNAIGTNAIPFLLDYVRHQEPAWAIKLDDAFMGRLYTEPYFMTDLKYQKMAMSGFAILGSNALPAMEALKRLAKDQDPRTRYKAFPCIILMHAGEKVTWPILLDGLQDPDPEISEYVAYQMHYNFPDRAESAGVYQKLPQLRHSKTNNLSTNTPATK